MFSIISDLDSPQDKNTLSENFLYFLPSNGFNPMFLIYKLYFSSVVI